MLAQVAHAPLNQIEHLGGEGAHRAFQVAMVGDHVGGFAGLDHGDGDHGRVNGFFVAGDDGLKGLHELASNGEWVHAIVGERGVGAFAANGDAKLVGGCHHGARAQGELASGQSWPVVHRVDGLHGKALKETVFDHLARPTPAFFGGLKNQIHRSLKIGVLGQVLGRCQEHGGVSVVAARVHAPGVDARVGKAVFLAHGEGVHVGPESDGTCAVSKAAFDHAHHPSFAQTRVKGDAPAFEQIGHHFTGAFFLEAQLGVGVQVAPDGGELGGFRDDGVEQMHGRLSMGFRRHGKGPRARTSIGSIRSMIHCRRILRAHANGSPGLGDLL